MRYPNAKIRAALLQRPAMEADTAHKTVADILAAVQQNGDAALRKYALQFDKVKQDRLTLTAKEWKEAASQLPKDLKEAIRKAQQNIARFHRAQQRSEKKITTTPGVVCWRESRAIEKVGLYIPGGTAPLFSTVLMLATPAKIAGCQQVVLCTPPGKDGKIHPAILFAAQLCGVTAVYKTGGAQAIAAMAYGTQSVPKVDKIFGPGNRFVTLAKQLVQQQGVAIDMPAGPSEVLVVADETCVPAFVAADLLSQAEHGPDSQVLLVTWKEALLQKVREQVQQQLKALPRQAIASAALQHSKLILVKDKAEALQLINDYAPEHLIVAVKDKKYFTKHVANAGSVFIGNNTPESAGDYASGTNHTLPTNGYARMYSGVSLDSFTKKITFQKISRKGLMNLGPVIETMAAAEQLIAHKNAVSIRLKHLKRKP